METNKCTMLWSQSYHYSCSLMAMWFSESISAGNDSPETRHNITLKSGISLRQLKIRVVDRISSPRSTLRLVSSLILGCVMIGGDESLIESRSILAGCHWVPTRASASFRDEVRVTLYRPVSMFQEKRKLAW